MVNKVPALCKDRKCLFSYSKALAPKITSVFPQSGGQKGSSITIFGSKLSNDSTLVSVFLGDAVCKVQETNATALTCIPIPHPARRVRVSVHIDNVGYSLDCNTIYFEYSLEISNVSPVIGSTSGWNMVSITGEGFPTISYSSASPLRDNIPFLSNADFYVLFDGYICFVVESRLGEIVCQPQPHSAGTVDVLVSLNGMNQTLPSSYEYSVDKKATVSFLSPSEGMVFGGTSFVIIGKSFAQETDDEVSVSIGDTPCLMPLVEDTQINCTTSAHLPGHYGVYIVSPNFGIALLDDVATQAEDASVSFKDFLNDPIASIPSKFYLSRQLIPSFTYKLMVTGVSPCDGSILGGTTLTITGSGFGSSKENVFVTTSQGKQCEVTLLVDTTIQCTMPSSSQQHIITNNNQTSRK